MSVSWNALQCKLGAETCLTKFKKVLRLFYFKGVFCHLLQ